MSDPADINDRLEAAATKAEGGSEIMRRVANDPVGTYIETESGPLPSIAEWYKQQEVVTDGLPDRVEELEGFQSDVTDTSPDKGASLIPVGDSGSVADALAGANSSIASVSAGLLGVTELSDPAAAVTSSSTLNKANPNVSDPLLVNTAAQLHRVYNTGTGALSAQSPTTLGTFAVTRKYPVTAGQTYTLSMHGAPLGFIIYFTGSPFIGFYNADGSFHSQITTGFTRRSGDREVTFTVPAGAAKVAFSLRNAVDFTNANPLTEAALQICINNLMLNEGNTALSFVPYSDGSYNPTTALFTPVKIGDVVVVQQGEYAYIRSACQQSADKDVVWRVRFRHGVNYNRVDSRSGVVDFYGIRFIDKATPHGATIAAFNQSTAVHCAGMDESAPEKFNGMFLGGGHGVVGYTVTVASHDKTGVDVGSTWSDGTNTWVLTYIEGTTKLMFVRRYTGTATKWRISSNPPASATFTHVAGATHTASIAFTSPTSSQFIPIVRKDVFRLALDDVEITADGVYAGSNAVLNEIYSIMNPASQQDYLIANVGAASPNYTADAIAEQIRCFNEFAWNAWGAMSVRTGRGIKQEYDRSTGAMGDYWGMIQLQRLSLVGDTPPGSNSSVHLYVPEVNPVGGYNLRDIADITANADVVIIKRTDCDNPANPASHFCQIGKDTGGSVLSSHLYGYSRAEGVGVPVARAAVAETVMYFSSAEKQYPVAVDWEAGAATAGQVVTGTAFRAPFLPTDPQLTVPGVVVTMSGKNFCYITAHATLTRKAVAVPAKLNGLPVSAIKPSSNVTVHTDYVTNGEIVVSVTGGYGDVVLQIG